jgi:hypothetical protein
VPGDTNGVDDVFVRDLHTGNTLRISVSSSGQEGNDHSYTYHPSISEHGREAAFLSLASNLVPDDTTGTP